MARPRTVEDREVLAATARALGRVGPLRVTLGDIADEVGVTPSALVQRFGSKKALLLAVAEGGLAAVDARFAAARARTASPLAALVDALAEGTRAVQTPEQMANALAFLQLDVTDPDFRRVTLAHLDRLRAGIRALLEEARGAGELGPCDLDGLARAVEVAYHGALLSWAVRREGAVADALRHDLEAALRPWRAGG
jgi:AcrR family transcriptional regulator